MPRDYVKLYPVPNSTGAQLVEYRIFPCESHEEHVISQFIEFGTTGTRIPNCMTST